MIKVVKVGWDGIDPTGEDYHSEVSPDKIALGYFLNIPTLVQYPDGTIRTGNKVMVTPSGMDWLQRNYPVDLREAKGDTQ